MSPEAPQIGPPQTDEDTYFCPPTLQTPSPQRPTPFCLRHLPPTRAPSPTDSVLSNNQTPTGTPRTTPRKRVTFGSHVEVCPIPTRKQQKREEAKDSAEFLRNDKGFLLNKKDIYTQNLGCNPTFFNRNKEAIKKGVCTLTVMLGVYSIPAGLFTMFLSSFPLGLGLVLLGSILTGAGAYNLPKERGLVPPKSR